MQCFARLVRVVLGADAIENKKLDYGMSLVVLGAEISFDLIVFHAGLHQAL